MTDLAATDELFFERTGMEPSRVEAIVAEAQKIVADALG